MTYVEHVHIDEEGHRTVVHVPVRTPEEFAAWFANFNRVVQRVCPGYRLKPMTEDPYLALLNTEAKESGSAL